MSLEEEILPCPFCPEDEAKKAPPTILYHKKKHFEKNHFTVHCTNCGCQPDFYVDNEEEAIIHWNNRRSLTKDQQEKSNFNEVKMEIIETLKTMVNFKV